MKRFTLLISTIKKLSFFFLYYFIFKHFPSSSFFLLGNFSKKMRYLCCRNFFRRCGHHVNIDRNVSFGTGFGLEIGDNSGIGKNGSVPADIKIGKDVMIGPDVKILASNHKFDNIHIPMRLQGNTPPLQTTIEDDVWIGTNVLILPGRTIKKGSIIAAGTVLTKDFPEYSIAGGNPSRLIRSRL